MSWLEIALAASFLGPLAWKDKSEGRWALVTSASLIGLVGLLRAFDSKEFTFFALVASSIGFSSLLSLRLVDSGGQYRWVPGAIILGFLGLVFPQIIFEDAMLLRLGALIGLTVLVLTPLLAATLAKRALAFEESQLFSMLNAWIRLSLLIWAYDAQIKGNAIIFGTQLLVPAMALALAILALGLFWKKDRPLEPYIEAAFTFFCMERAHSGDSASLMALGLWNAGGLLLRLFPRLGGERSSLRLTFADRLGWGGAGGATFFGILIVLYFSTQGHPEPSWAWAFLPIVVGGWAWMSPQSRWINGKGAFSKMDVAVKLSMEAVIIAAIVVLAYRLIPEIY